MRQNGHSQSQLKHFNEPIRSTKTKEEKKLKTNHSSCVTFVSLMTFFSLSFHNRPTLSRHSVFFALFFRIATASNEVKERRRKTSEEWKKAAIERMKSAHKLFEDATSSFSILFCRNNNRMGKKLKTNLIAKIEWIPSGGSEVTEEEISRWFGTKCID